MAREPSYNLLLERKLSVIKREIAEGKMSKGDFLRRGLRELLETIEQENGIHGPIFSERDRAFHEGVDFIHEAYPDFDTRVYEEFLLRKLSRYNDVHAERLLAEKKVSLEKDKSKKGPVSNPFVMPIHKVIYKKC